PDHRDAFGFGRARLSRGRTRARVAQGQWPRTVRLEHRRPGARGVPRLLPHRRYHPRAGIRARACVRRRGRAHDDTRQGAADQSLGPGRQGHEHRCRAQRLEVPLPTRMRSRTALSENFDDIQLNRIDATFAKLRAAGRTALIPYVTAGDPSPAATVPLMHALVAAGADVVEIGVPFSDPMADGPVIQRASERALA